MNAAKRQRAAVFAALAMARAARKPEPVQPELYERLPWGRLAPRFVLALLMALVLGLPRVTAALMRLGMVGPGTRPSPPTLDLDWQPGLDKLSSALTINGVTVEPTFRYEASGASLDGWTAAAGSDLSLVGVGVNPAPGSGSPLIGGEAVDFPGPGANTYQATTDSLGDITTEDFVFELIWQHSTGDHVCGKRNGATGAMWGVFASTDTFSFVFGDGTSFPVISLSGLVPGAWYHGIVAGKRGGSMKGWINTAITGTNSIATIATTTNTGKFEIGSIGRNSTYFLDGSFAYCSLWMRDSWLDTHEQATLAAQRFQAATGAKARVARGSAYATTCSRTTAAYLDKIESDGRRRGYLVGPNWPRIVDREDKNGARVVGFLSEAQATNYCTNSDMTTAVGTWTDRAGATTAASSETDPLGRTCYSLTEDGSTAIFGAYDGISFANATPYVLSVFLKAQGSGRWAGIWYGADATIGSTFDLVNGVLGTTGAGATAYIEDWGDGWCRCSIAWTQSGNASSYFNIAAHTATGDVLATTHVGRSGIVQLMSAPQVEASVKYASSYIPTAGSAATRTKDVLTYSPAGNCDTSAGKKGSIAFSFLAEDYNGQGAFCLLEVGNNQVSERFIVVAGTNDDSVSLYSSSGGGAATAADSTDVVDGAVHDFVASWKADESISLDVDGTTTAGAGTPSIPPTVDRINIGVLSYVGSIYQPRGVIGRTTIRG